MMITGAVFNIYTLRGGAFRDPQIYLADARWVESTDAAILLDIHGPTLKGEAVVREAIERSVDQVQLIHDQTLRLIAHGMDAREVAENLYMPRALREGREAYGQVESHARQVYNGTVAGSATTSTTSTRCRCTRKRAAPSPPWAGAPPRARRPSTAPARAGWPTGAGA